MGIDDKLHIKKFQVHRIEARKQKPEVRKNRIYYCESIKLKT